jgi:hypothetical protein
MMTVFILENATDEPLGLAVEENPIAILDGREQEGYNYSVRF